MKFSQKIIALQHKPWSDHYLDYNGLKRILAEVEVEERASEQDIDEPISLLSVEKLKDEPGTSAKFLRHLEDEVDKITLFVLKEQGKIADDLAICDEERRRLRLSSSSLSSQSSDGNIDIVGLSKSCQSLRDMYNRVGADLLQLIQFVDLNAKGIKRILKKHDKRVKPVREAYDAFLGLRGNSRSGVMVAPLLHGEPLAALCVALQTAFTDLRSLSLSLGQSQQAEGAAAVVEVEPLSGEADVNDVERGRPRLDINKSKSKRSVRDRSPKALPRRRFRSIQGLEDAYKVDDDDDLELAEVLPDDQFLTLSTRYQSELRHSDSLPILSQDAFIMAQIYAARRALKQQSNDVVNMLATTALAFPAVPPEIILPGQDDAIKAEYERAAALAAYKRSSATSSVLNLVSSFIYMANYLIVVPTVVTYSEKLGSDPALSSAIVGMTPFATIFSTIVYSWWTSYSYRWPLFTAAFLNVVGNFIYALGYPLKSMECVLVGRLLSGLGSCRPINRRYIADAYSTAERTAASAHFVAVGSFGMALGPFLGAVLHRTAAHSSSPYWQEENAPGWFMCAVWSVYLLFHVIFFVDPPREKDKMSTAAPKKDGKLSNNGETKPLLNEKADTKSILSDDDSSATRVPIWRNAAIMTNFFIYFVEKLVMECVSSSTSILTYYYFDWPGSWAGYYLSFLCLLVLPVNLLVAHLSKIYEDRQMMIAMQAATVVGCVVIIRYGKDYYIEQYLLGSMMIVVFSNMVEGPNMSLLSKTIPKSWRKGFLNVGLLATEAATLGRTMGDVYLALCGAGGLENQLNYTFGGMTLVTIFTLWISWRFYDALIPTEDKNL